MASTIPPELASVLASINARLAAIEAAVGGGGGGGGGADAGETYCRLASDFQASVVNVTGAKAIEAAENLGEEGKKLVRQWSHLV